MNNCFVHEGSYVEEVIEYVFWSHYMNKFLNRFAYIIDDILKKIKDRAMQYKLTMYPNIHESVKLGSDVKLMGPENAFYIGERTYINDAVISAGNNAKVIIGKNCAIGYRVSIKAVTHDIEKPSPDEKGSICTVEADIKIGDFCWMGDNVFIREGVTLGNNVVVGANSVVTRSFQDNVVIAGVPAKII